MTRRDLMLLGVASAAAPIALLVAGRAAQAIGPIDDPDKGTIYLYAWGGGEGQQGIFALDPERRKWTKVADQSDSTSFDTYFRVSHDGRSLAFAKLGREGDDQAVVGISIRDLARIGAIRDLPIAGFNAIWSPDARQLLVAVGKGKVPGTRMTRTESWIVNADGSEPRKLSIPDTEQVDDWSPDGSWILTGSHRDEGVGYQIYRMRLDGSDARRLTTTGKGVLNLHGRISPDGRQVAYFRVGDRQSGIWVMNADGSDPRRIFEAKQDAIPGWPAWSPDGRRIAIAVHAERRHEKGYLESYDPRLILLDPAGGEPATIAPPLSAGVGEPQWAPSLKP